MQHGAVLGGAAWVQGGCRRVAQGGGVLGQELYLGHYWSLLGHYWLNTVIIGPLLVKYSHYWPNTVIIGLKPVIIGLKIW